MGRRAKETPPFTVSAILVRECVSPSGRRVIVCDSPVDTLLPDTGKCGNPQHRSNRKKRDEMEGRKKRRTKFEKKKGKKAREKESIYMLVPIHDPLIYPSPFLGIL